MNLWQPSSLLNHFEESATLAIAGRAKELALLGRSIIDFGAGEPDVITSPGIIEQALEAAQKGQTKYTSVAGTLALRQSLAERLSQDYKIPLKPTELIVSSGGKQAIYHFLQATLEPEDEVLILSPYWVSFPEMVKLVGGIPKIVRRVSQGWAFSIEQNITPKTRMLILNNPCNPSGSLFSAKELREIVKVVEKYPIWILSDDTYYKLVYPPAFWTSILHLRPDFKERTCVVGSCSKSFAMTGWRVGWAVASEKIISAMVKLQSQVTSCASSVSQAAAHAAFNEFYDVSDQLRELFMRRRAVMVEQLKKIPGLSWEEPQGAFYVFVRFAALLKGKSVTHYCQELLENHGVCAIPGEAFGEPEFVRLSYALSEENIHEGMKRVEKSLKELT